MGALHSGEGDGTFPTKRSGVASFATAIFVISVVLSTSTPYGQPTDLDSAMEDPTYVKQVILLPAIENLKLASAEKSPNLRGWLDQLKLESHGMYHVGPGALAYEMSNGLPVVQIDMMFVAECVYVSDLAGLLIAGPSNDQMYEVGRQYGEQLSESILAGEPQPPILKVDMGSLPITPGQKVSANRLGLLALGSVVQWVILHEIGHHQLDHFVRDPLTLAESRQWELDADTWAIEFMQDLGYGLDPLDAVMQAFLLEEELRRLAGLVIPTESSTHPSWTQRIANLEKFDVKSPPSFGNFRCILEVSSLPLTGEFFANELWIPRRSMPGVMSQFDQFGQVIQMPVEFHTDGSVHIYGRNQTDFTEVIVSNLNSLYPDITFRYTNAFTGQVSESFSRGYQMDLGAMMSTPVKGFQHLAVRDVMELDPISYFKENLLLVESHPDKVNRAISIQEQSLWALNTALLMYAKGAIELDVAQEMIVQATTAGAEEMRLLLGDTKYQLLQEQILSNPTTTSALEKLLK